MPIKRKPLRPGRKKTVMLKSVNPIIADFERFMGIANMSEGGRALGMTRQGYHQLRHKKELPLVLRLAMRAIAQGLTPYGEG